MNRRIYLLFSIPATLMVVAIGLFWFFIELSRNVCAKHLALSEKALGKTAEGCFISEVTLKRSDRHYKCYLDTFKMIRCPTSTRVPGAESMTSTGFKYKSGDDSVTTP